MLMYAARKLQSERELIGLQAFEKLWQFPAFIDLQQKSFTGRLGMNTCVQLS